MIFAALLVVSASCSSSAAPPVGPTTQVQSPAPTPPADVPPSPPATQSPSSTPAVPYPSIGTAPAAPAPVPVPDVPTRLVVPAIGADLAVIPDGVDDTGQMALPKDPAVASWYQYGADPGADSGAVVIAAHVDSAEYGIGPLSALRKLAAGDSIIVYSGSTQFEYVVDTVQQIDKGEIDMTAVFSRDGEARLHVLTCGGTFDPVTRNYSDNVLAIAEPK